MKMFKGWLFALVTVFMALSATQANATHGRFGHFTWTPRPDISATTVDFRLIVAYRRSYFGNPNLGDTFQPGAFNFGDGSSASYRFEVIALNQQEDWIIGQAYVVGGDPGVVRHTYPAATRSNGEPWEAYLSSCCRISSLRNSADSNFRYATRVDLSLGNTSPVSSVPPIVSCPRGACRFSIPVVDANNDPIRWSLTPLSESGIRRNPTGLTVDPQTGIVDWTDGSSAESLGLYALSVTIEDLDDNGDAKSSVVTDFLINLQDFVNNQPPEFDMPPSPQRDANLTAIVGQEFVLDIQASDVDLNDQVFVNNLGLPTGATWEVLSQGNPTAARLSWTPSMTNVGSHIVTFTATDQKAASALQLPVIIEVIQPAISNVRVIDRISTNDIEVDLSSFTVAPDDVYLDGDRTIVEWHYDTFEVGQVENLIFDLQLYNLQPGETRLVIHDLELTYDDVNGNPITTSLGSRSVLVAETVLSLATATDKIQYKPNETVVISTQLVNQDEITAEGEVNLTILDAQGNLVQALGGFSETLSPLETRILTGLDFNVGNLIVGHYKVRAELLNTAGKLVATSEAPFEVVTEDGNAIALASQVHSDKPVYAAWDAAILTARLQNTASNAVVGATDNHIVVTSPNGSVLFSDVRFLSSVAPSAVQDFTFYLDLNDAMAGTYQVRWTTLNPDSGEELAVSSTSFQVEREVAQSIVGNVSVAQAQVYHTGSNQCDFRIDNRGQAASGNVEYAYSLIHFDSEQSVFRNTLEMNLAGGETHQWDNAIDANNLLYGGYGCVLEGKFNGQWQVISSAGFEVLPPKVDGSLQFGSKGRLLVLADAPRECSALEDIQVEIDFEDSISAATKIQVLLYSDSGALLDTEVISQFNVDTNVSINNTSADLIANASASGLIKATVRAPQDHLGSHYKVKVKVTKSYIFTTSKEWFFDTTCDRPFTIGELYEDVKLLAYHPWLGDDELKSVDPFGPLDGPSVDDQQAYLEALLQEEGWEYTLVHDAAEFAEAHRSGSYDVYLLLAERPMLSLLVQKEVREAVFNGAGLVFGGAYDKRNLWLEHSLGLTVVGRHPWAEAIEQESSVLSSEQTLPLLVDDWVFGAYLDGADQVGTYTLVGDDLLSNWFWLDQGSFSLTDLFNFKRRAVTTNQYGKGKSVYFGFDVLLEAAHPAAENGYTDLIKNALSQVNPASLNTQGSKVIPVQVSLTNRRGATTGRAILTLPEGAALPVSTPFVQAGTAWVWDFSIDEQQILSSRVYVQLPETAGTATLNLDVATDIDGQYLDQKSTSIDAQVTPLPTAADTLDSLDQLAWTYWYRLSYRDAYYKFEWAKAAMEAEDWITAQSLLLVTTNLLMFDDEADVESVRQQIDTHIRYVGMQLNAQ